MQHTFAPALPHKAFDGRPVVAAQTVSDPAEGTYHEVVILAVDETVRNRGCDHAYSTHRAAWQDDTETPAWTFYSGHYDLTKSQAEADYYQRSRGERY